MLTICSDAVAGSSYEDIVRPITDVNLAKTDVGRQDGKRWKNRGLCYSIISHLKCHPGSSSAYEMLPKAIATGAPH